MIATRTRSSSRALPFCTLPFVWAIASDLLSHSCYVCDNSRFAIRLPAEAELAADVEDPLEDGQPGRRGQKRNRGDEQPDAHRREHEAAGDDDDPLGARADADVPTQAESLGTRARVADEERARDRCERQRERNRMVMAREHECDRAE